MPTLLALLALLLPSLPAGAADIYRWVDENGKVQISDTVPEKYRKSAKRIDSGQYEVTPQQRAAAEALAERDRERAKTSAAVAAQKKAAAAQKAKAAAPQAAAPVAPAETDCDKAHRLYKESLDCFAPFISPTGATRPEAFNFCTPVSDPSTKCGPPKPESLD